MTKQSIQAGFTLLELLISLVILGLVSAAVSMSNAGLTSVYRFAQQEKQYATSTNVAGALMDYAEQVNDGRLPAPQSFSYQGANYRSSVLNINQTGANSLHEFLIANNVSPEHALHDGSASKRVRVYQMFSRNLDIPVEGFGGSTVQIQYDVGAVYDTDCSAFETCMTSGTRPGDSPDFTDASFSTWSSSEFDGQSVTFSTQIIQIELWEKTHQRLMEARNKLADIKTAEMFQASAEDVLTNNYNPKPSPHTTGRNAPANDHCYSSWVNLSPANSVLTQAGLSPALYGTTSWGGNVQYCANYDPSNSGETNPPFNAAIRVHRNVTTGANPTNSTNNIYYVF